MRPISEKQREHLARARLLASAKKRKARDQKHRILTARFQPLANALDDANTAKIALALLYLAEGGKNRKGALMFGNSDPGIICLFLRLLRQCYAVREDRFRCTVQCRSGQHAETLERFWSKTTNIPRTQFYKTRVDQRTAGKPVKNPAYKGVCRIDYFSADIFTELTIIARVLTHEGRWRSW